MRIWRRSSAPTERDLVGLADGSLRGRRRAEVERALADHPELRSAVAAQRRVLEAVQQAATQDAPPALRARLALALPPGRPRARRRIAGLTAGVTALVGATAGAIVALTDTTAVAGASVLQASLLSSRAAEGRVGQPRGSAQSLPGVRADGLTYPYWEDDRLGFQATGVRYDRVGGQLVTTVFYSRGPSRVAYEIVSGAPLRLGAAATSAWRHGVLFRILSSPRGPVVTWMRHGHTCVLVGDHAGLEVLLRLAAWQKGGRIPY